MKTKYIFIAIFLFCSNPARADYDFNDGRTLLLMVEELDYLIGLANDQSKVPRSSEFVFNYDALSDDLKRIRELIRYHMDNASKQPNQIEPLLSGVDPVNGMYSNRKY